MSNELHTKTTTARHLAPWILLALVCVLIGVFLSPQRMVGALDQKAEKFRESLQSGIALVRFAFISGAFLAILSAIGWRLDGGSRTKTTQKLQARDWAIAAALLTVTMALRATTLNSALWWDELTTLTMVVRKGLPTILAWSANANNHILNSALIWLVRAFAGEGELQTRLPAYLLGSAIPVALFLSWRPILGRRLSVVAGLVAVLHFSLHVHATEARGYAGAVLFVCLAQAALVRMIESPSRTRIAWYVGSCVAAVGFLPVAALVPVAHGVVAAFRYLAGRLRGDSTENRVVWKSVWFSAMWGIVMAVVVFGLPMVQTLAYASHGAQGDHMELSATLADQLLKYLVGVPNIAVAAVVLVVCGIAWAAKQPLPGLRMAFVAPAALAAIWLVLPNGRYSPRLFFFVLPTAIMGLALAGDHLFRAHSRILRWCGVAMGCVWGIGLAPNYHRRLTIGNPDLNGLSKRIQPSHGVLVGMQADVNASFYFRGVPFFRNYRDAWEHVRSNQEVDVVVEGVQSYDGTPLSRELLNHGFSIAERVESWTDQVGYIVYRRL